MTVYPRLRMRLSLEERRIPSDVRHRTVERSDTAAVGELLLAAYRGTVDDEGGETRDDAVAEVERVLDGANGPFVSDASFVVEDEDGLAGASLVAIWEVVPLLCYIVVHPRAQRRGVGTFLIERTGNALLRGGYPELDLFVTEENGPAVDLYRKLGFEMIDRVDRPPGEA